MHNIRIKTVILINTLLVLLNSLQLVHCAHLQHMVYMHVIVAPQSLTVNIKRRNFFIVLDIVQLVFSVVQISSLQALSLTVQ